MANFSMGCFQVEELLSLKVEITILVNFSKEI